MANSSEQPSPKQAIDFFHLLQNLKVTKRTGWVRKKVDGPESISDHMYRMGMMAFIATDSSIDVNKCMKMALVHDVAEALVGDITPNDGVSQETKYKMESDAILQIKKMLGEETHAAEEIEELWQEYESASSSEAQFVKDLDKLEMILQAHEYESTQNIDLSDFFTSTEGVFKTETGKAWAQEVVMRRVQEKSSR